MTTVIVATLVVIATSVRAESAGVIRSLQVEPIAPRGGVLMIPLVADPPGDDWPQTVRLEMMDGRSLLGQVGWMHPLTEPPARSWTVDLRGLGIRPIRFSDDSSDRGNGTPYLLVRLPAHGQGALRLGRQLLNPRWVDVPSAIDPTLQGVSFTEHLERETAPDRPDATSPFEYWRWMMLAETMQRVAPPPGVGSDVEALAAAHYGQLWRIGLGRVASVDPQAAIACRDLLSRTCRDEFTDFAAWVADPQRVGDLLSTTLNFERDAADVALEVRAWLDAQPDILIWVDNDLGPSVTLAIVNRGAEPQVARVSWDEVAAPPQPFDLPSGALTRVQVSRPGARPAVDPDLPGAAMSLPRTLRVDVGQSTLHVPVGPALVPARPPGLMFPALRAPTSLAEIERGARQPINPVRATFMQVRRLRGRWEVFLDCRRVGAIRTPVELPTGLAVDDAGTWRTLGGIEAVSLLIGPAPLLLGDAPSTSHIRLTVPESGWHQIVGAQNDGSLQIHVMSHQDRWHARIVLPDAWLNLYADTPTLLACVRTHGGRDDIEAGPGAVLPWRLSPARAPVDLSKWDDLPAADAVIDDTGGAPIR